MVRPATLEDAEAIARVHIRSWQAAYTHLFSADELAGLSLPGRTRWWADAIEGGWRVLVAAQDGAVVGFASCGKSTDDDASALGELMTIYVDPDAWGRGVGQRLIAEIESSLREKGFQEALLWVAEDNPRTRRFYEAAGWKADGTQRPVELLGREISEVRYRKKL
jgi:ribosomal protein S18 acetylase RimI-like enzyme